MQFTLFIVLSGAVAQEFIIQEFNTTDCSGEPSQSYNAGFAPSFLGLGSDEQNPSTGCTKVDATPRIEGKQALYMYAQCLESTNVAISTTHYTQDAMFDGCHKQTALQTDELTLEDAVKLFDGEDKTCVKSGTKGFKASGNNPTTLKFGRPQCVNDAMKAGGNGGDFLSTTAGPNASVHAETSGAGHLAFGAATFLIVMLGLA